MAAEGVVLSPVCGVVCGTLEDRVIAGGDAGGRSRLQGKLQSFVGCVTSGTLPSDYRPTIAPMIARSGPGQNLGINTAYLSTHTPTHSCRPYLSMYVLLAYWEKRERGLCSLGP